MSAKHLMISVATLVLVAGSSSTALAQPRQFFFPRPISPRPFPQRFFMPNNSGMTTPLTDDQKQRIFLRMAARQQTLAFRDQSLMARQQTLSYMSAMNTPSYPSSSYSMPYYPMPYSSGYGGANAGMGNFKAAAPVAPAPDPAMKLLAGIVNDKGEVAWPLGLQILTPGLETKEMRHKAEGLLRTAAEQATQGRAAVTIVEDAGKAVAQLRERLNAQRVGMPEATYNDAVAFLERMDSTLQTMR